MQSARLLLILFALLEHYAATAQVCPKIPEEYSWNTAEDYKKDKNDIKKCLEYLCLAPLDNTMERSEVNAYVMEWLSGAPELKIDIDSRAMPFLAEQEELIFTVIHGMALYQMNHPNVTDRVMLHARGLEVLAKLVKQNKELEKLESVKAILKADRHHKLEMWVCEQFNS